MKRKMRKGFTLVELLVVISIISGFAAMMATSSSESIDAASASAILNNLQSMKTAAFEMYMEEPEVASMATIANDTNTTIVKTAAVDGDPGTPAVYFQVGEVLGERLGRIDIADKYGIVGTDAHWFVYYTFDTNDNASVKAKLKDKASNAGLYGGAAAEVASFTAYYTGTEANIALKVR